MFCSNCKPFSPQIILAVSVILLCNVLIGNSSNRTKKDEFTVIKLYFSIELSSLITEFNYTDHNEPGFRLTAVAEITDSHGHTIWTPLDEGFFFSFQFSAPKRRHPAL